MQKIILVSFFVIVATALSAQKYTTAAGIRAGSGIGLTLQQRIGEKFTVEGIAQKSLFKNESYIAALMERHIKLVAKGLNFYVGAGPHVAFNKMNVTDDKGMPVTYTSTGYGASAIGGVEMRFGRMVFSLDYVPSINFNGGDNLLGSRTGISARYILIKAKKKEQKWMFWKKWKKNREDSEAEWN
jgi:hypothetical protein